MYSDAVLDHFKNPRNAGDLPGATASAEVSNPACGDVLWLAVKFNGKTFTDVRFKVRGCVSSIACGSVLAEMLQGKTLRGAAGITAQRISEKLDGLPRASFHAAQLARDALDAILAKLR